MKYLIKKSSTDVSLDVFIQDSSVTTGAGLTGLVFNTASLTCYYHRPGSAPVQLALITQTVAGAHSDGGFVALDGTNMPGWYRLDLSDAIVLTGVRSVGVMLKGAANMVPCNIEIQLVSWDTEAAMASISDIWAGADLSAEATMVAVKANTDTIPSIGSAITTAIPVAAAGATGGLATYDNIAAGVPIVGTPSNFSEMKIDANTGEVSAKPYWRS